MAAASSKKTKKQSKNVWIPVALLFVILAGIAIWKQLERPSFQEPAPVDSQGQEVPAEQIEEQSLLDHVSRMSDNLENETIGFEDEDLIMQFMSATLVVALDTSEGDSSYVFITNSDSEPETIHRGEFLPCDLVAQYPDLPEEYKELNCGN